MSRKCYRFYGGLVASQERWLNKMAENGYRLTRIGKLLYEFEECKPEQYQYCVEFIGQKSMESADDYVRFLEDWGYRVLYKNINLNGNVGKVVARPWAERGARIASNRSTLNRELLIVEKENDGKPFELHTTYEDKLIYYKNMRRPWIFLFIVSVVLGIVRYQLVWGVFAAISLITLILFQFELRKLKKQADIKEL